VSVNRFKGKIAMLYAVLDMYYHDEKYLSCLLEAETRPGRFFWAQKQI
jgi:hypothetical protein